ncbi:tRNA pseudouridine(55) synthase TruB [bacterium]|jgi:tRNA pseudouridine55 synthase|nr:tRNA pseudouridine(55) synthase TruB [bacterium]
MRLNLPLTLSEPFGYLFIDKSEGVTSFSVVGKVRKCLGVKKVGFAGTLDPFSSGLLIMGVGRNFTKHMDGFHLLPKTYKVVMVLGISTDTLDSYGKITSVDESFKRKVLDSKQVATIFESFVGKQDQLPPIFSAKKVNGRRLYSLARNTKTEAEIKAIEATIKAASVTVHRITVDSVDSYFFPQIQFTVTCSKGTYIRSLCRDIAEAFDTVGYAKNLIRSQIGSFCVDDAIPLSDVTKERSVESLVLDPLYYEKLADY